MLGRVYLPDDTPPSIYIFGSLLKAPARYWTRPVQFSNEPEHIIDCLDRWETRSGYAGWTPTLGVLIGLTLRDRLTMDRYWESPPEPATAMSGSRIVPRQESGDQVHLWAPVLDSPGQIVAATGNLVLTVSPSLDFQRLLNSFFRDSRGRRLLRLFMSNSDDEGNPISWDQNREIVRFLDHSSKGGTDAPDNTEIGLEHQFKRLVC